MTLYTKNNDEYIIEMGTSLSIYDMEGKHYIYRNGILIEEYNSMERCVYEMIDILNAYYNKEDFYVLSQDDDVPLGTTFEINDIMKTFENTMKEHNMEYYINEDMILISVTDNHK